MQDLSLIQFLISAIDSTPYNHYSLLRTTEDALGIYEYLNEAGNTAQGIKPMTALFARSE